MKNLAILFAFLAAPAFAAHYPTSAKGLWGTQCWPTYVGVSTIGGIYYAQKVDCHEALTGDVHYGQDANGDNPTLGVAYAKDIHALPEYWPGVGTVNPDHKPGGYTLAFGKKVRNVRITTVGLPRDPIYLQRLDSEPLLEVGTDAWALTGKTCYSVKPNEPAEACELYQATVYLGDWTLYAGKAGKQVIVTVLYGDEVSIANVASVSAAPTYYPSEVAVTAPEPTEPNDCPPGQAPDHEGECQDVE